MLKKNKKIEPAGSSKELTDSQAKPAERMDYQGPNSRATAFPNFNEQGIFNAGMTKAEYAMVHFVTAHLQAQGKYPTKEQLVALGELAVHAFDTIIVIVCPDPKGIFEDEDFEDPDNFLE